MFEKDGIVYESEEEYQLEKIVHEKKNNPLISSIIALLVLIIVFFASGAGILALILSL